MQAAAMGSLLVTQVRLWRGRGLPLSPQQDILIRDGRVAATGDDLAAPAGSAVEEGRGRIAIPGLVEAHTHLGYSLLGLPWFRNEVGPTLTDKIQAEKDELRRRGIDPELQSTRQLVRSAELGSTLLRGHVAIDTDVGLSPLEGVLRSRDVCHGTIEVQTVAFPQAGLLSRPGTLELMEEALRIGADIVGGLDPSQIDRDPRGSLDMTFGLAERSAKPVDIHLHEPGELGAFSIELILERTRALGLQGRVMISHGFCLGDIGSAHAGRLGEMLAREQVAIMTTAPLARACPSLALLSSLGVIVCSGSDGVRDIWGPFNNADMLERAMLLAQRNGFRRDDDLELALDSCTFGGARALGVADYGLHEGARADLVLLTGETLADAIVSRSADRTVVRQGMVIARHSGIVTAAAS